MGDSPTDWPAELKELKVGESPQWFTGLTRDDGIPHSLSVDGFVCRPWTHYCDALSATSMFALRCLWRAACTAVSDGCLALLEGTALYRHRNDCLYICASTRWPEERTHALVHTAAADHMVKPMQETVILGCVSCPQIKGSDLNRFELNACRIPTVVKNRPFPHHALI